MMYKTVATPDGGVQVPLSAEEQAAREAEWAANKAAIAEIKRREGHKRRRQRQIRQALSAEDRFEALVDGFEALVQADIPLPESTMRMLNAYRDAKRDHPRPQQ